MGPSGQDRHDLAMAALAEVEDPEIPLSVVDLGLIYGLVVNGPTVTVTMTLTSLGCPAERLLKELITQGLGEVPGVEKVVVDVVWSPPWTKANVTENGRFQLQTLGIAV